MFCCFVSFAALLPVDSLLRWPVYVTTTHLSIASCQIMPRSTRTVCSSAGALPVACLRMKRTSLTRVTFSPAAPKSVKIRKKNEKFNFHNLKIVSKLH